MNGQTIKCSNCGFDIELTEALAGQFEEAVRVRFEAEVAKKENETGERNIGACVFGKPLG